MMRGVPTVALTVTNPTRQDAPPCRVRFQAAFATRATHPVTVRDDRDRIVASRFVRDERDFDAPGLPSGKFLWTLTLEFVLTHGLAAQARLTFTASYEATASLVTDWDTLPLRSDLPVMETIFGG